MTLRLHATSEDLLLFLLKFLVVSLSPDKHITAVTLQIKSDPITLKIGFLYTAQVTYR